MLTETSVQSSIQAPHAGSAGGKAEGHIPTLDGLRAVAILVVIASHALPIEDYPRIASLGHLGVMLFFALSGFLITSRLLDEDQKNGRISLRNFYLRRVFRILPPACFYLGVLAVGTATGLLVCNWASIRAALLLYTNYAPPSELGWKAGHFWSLSVEEHFYLFWPFALIFFGVRKGWRTALVMIAGICVWRIADNHYQILAQGLHMPWLAGGAFFRTDLIADTLLWGCVLAFYYRRPDRRTPNAAVATVLTLVLMGLLALPFEIDIHHVSFAVDLLPSLVLGVIVSAPRAPIGRFLELAPMKVVGRLSYSLYIWQQFFFGGPGYHLPRPLAVVALVACAALSYWCVEQPMIRFGRRFIKRSKPAPVLAA